ncbi:MAG TPA: alpha/beta hydrolase-fold protein, partial [Gemmata sp.]|nr:alpha/beta hydrolase-fold protein [Gemmata sp.]
MHSPWQRILIGGIPAEVLDPGAGALRHALLWLHDEPAEPVATNSRLTRELLARRLRCVAPLATDSWWLDRVSPQFHPEISAEQHLLDTVIPWMESDAGFGCQGFAVAGIGIGGQGALRLGFRHPDRVPVVASIAGALDFHELYGRGTVLD